MVVYYPIGEIEELENLAELEDIGNSKGSIERWHTEWRERVVVRTDTVYRDREVVVQLPPERYVPRAVKGLAWTGAATITMLLLWVVWRICRR